MPKLLDATMEELKTSSNYSFSAVKLDKLGSSKYTLVTIALDVSASVDAFKHELEQTLKTVIGSCQKSPESENLMIRLITFNNTVTEVHGFKLLSSINDSDYDNILNPSGGTALFDAAYTIIDATKDFSTILYDQDYDANAILFIITDGDDNCSTYSALSIKNLIQDTLRAECLYSLNVVLVGVNTDNNYVKDKLEAFKQHSNLNQYIDMNQATPANLAKLAKFISRSISSTSRALSSGSTTTASDILVF